MFKILSIVAIAAAGLIHILLAPVHYAHAPAHGIFFAAAGVAEILWSLAFWRKPARGLYYWGVAMAGGLIVLWAITRFVVSPFEHEPGLVDIGGLACKASELLGLVALGALAIQGKILGLPRSPLARTAGTALILALVVGTVTYGAGLALEPLLPSLAGAEEQEHAGESAEMAQGGDEHTHAGGAGEVAATLGDLEIRGPYAGVASRGGTGGVFFTIRNTGHTADRLVSAQSPAAAVTEIHQTVMEGDVMKMTMLEGGLEIPAGGEVVLEHGSYHVMLVDLQQDLKAGEHFDLSLDFEHAGSVSVAVEVRAP